MKFLYIVIIMVSILFLGGCGDIKERVVVKERKLPAWYLHPPASNSREMYGVGEGKDKKEAVMNALSSLLATLSVSVSSKYRATTVVHEGRINSSDAVYFNETESEVKKIRISSYEVLHAVRFGFKKYVVLVKVERMKFFKTLQEEIEEEFEHIAEREKSGFCKDSLCRFLFYKKIVENLSSLKNRLIVMSVLNKNFHSQKYLQKYEQLLNKRDALLQKITFWVVSDYTPLSRPIEKGLSLKKIKIKKIYNRDHFTVYIKSVMQKAKFYGFYIVKAAIDIATKDSNGNILAINRLNITGQSSQNFAIAKEEIVKKLDKLVDKKGIGKVLNLDI